MNKMLCEVYRERRDCTSPTNHLSLLKPIHCPFLKLFFLNHYRFITISLTIKSLHLDGIVSLSSQLSCLVTVFNLILSIMIYIMLGERKTRLRDDISTDYINLSIIFFISRLGID